MPDRLRRVAAAHTAAVAAAAALGGLLVRGQSGYLVAWVYTGGAVALPALLLNWMIAHREIGSMPGGRAWSVGLVWVYLDGLGLLYLAAEPGSPLRALAVPAVVPPIACFAVAAVELARQRARPRAAPASRPPGDGDRELPARRVLGLAALVALTLGAATAVGLAGRATPAGARWLLAPSALVAVATTTGAVVCARYRSTSPLGRVGLAALSCGAANAWAMVAQVQSDFSLPASPLLALQAVTMGLLLQVPVHAPRQAGDGTRRRSRAEVVSRAWLADDPAEDGVLPARLRRPAIVYVAVATPVAGAIGLLVEGRSAFLVSWVYVSAAFTTPAMVVTWVASRRTRHQVGAWRLWFVAVVALYLDGAGLLLTVLAPDLGIEPLATLAVLPTVGLFGAAAIAMMRARSGSRSVAVDVVETTMVTIVICFGVLVLAGDGVWRSDEAWFTIPTAVVTVAMTSGLAWSVMIYTRMPHESRALETVGLALAVAGTVDAWAMLAQGLSGFTLPSAPLLALQALAMGLLFLLPLYVPRTAPPGLEQLPPHEQVRNSWALVALALATLPVLYVQASLARETRPWAPTLFLVVLAALLFLAMTRQAIAIRETRHLYDQVVRGAEERRRLLAEVMRTVDAERHRVAAQLHEQAIASSAAFASLGNQVERVHPRQGTTVLAEASARLRRAFGAQAESLRGLMLAMQPLGTAGDGALADRLSSPIRAHLDSLYGDTAPPVLRLDVADGLTLAWTTEAVVLRVVQEALGNVHRHAAARRVDVRLGLDEQARLTVTVTDDGRGFVPDAVDERGIATMRSFAALIGAELTVDSRPGDGTTVRLRVVGDGVGDGVAAGGPDADGPDADPTGGGAPPGRPHLRLVDADGG